VGIYEKSDDRVKWKLLEYVSPSGRPAIENWRDDFVTATRKADLDVFLRNMVKKSDWVPPDITSLKGKHLKGFRELRWRSDDGVPYRIGGYFSADDEFVMLIGWTHNKKKYDPPAALDTLITRRRNLANKEATLREYKVFTGH
jgi:hypothetical protein